MKIPRYDDDDDDKKTRKKKRKKRKQYVVVWYGMVRYGKLYVRFQKNNKKKK